MVGGKNCFWTSAISFSTVTHNHMLPSTFFLLNKRQKNLCCAFCGDIYIHMDGAFCAVKQNYNSLQLADWQFNGSLETGDYRK